MNLKNNKDKIDSLRKKIWKSEMERQDLEYKFEKLMRERSNCEKSAIKVIKMRCERFMEHDRRRATRNSNLLKLLERIDYQAATLAAKTERLRLLKAQHELYLMKNWDSNRFGKQTEWSQPHQFQSTLGISNTSPQNYCPPTECITTKILPPKPPPPLISPYEGENNLRSDFVKYLSQVKHFNRPAYDNKSSPPTSTPQPPIEGVGSSYILAGGNHDHFPNTADYHAQLPYEPLARMKFEYDIDRGRSKPDVVGGGGRRQYLIPELHVQPPADSAETPEHAEFYWQNPKTIKGTPETCSAYEQEQYHHHPPRQPLSIKTIETAPQHLATSSDGNLLANNSFSMRAEINNAAVSISNTSDHAGAININGDIKTIHQNEDENNISVKYQISGNSEVGVEPKPTKSDGSKTADNSQLIGIDYGNNAISKTSAEPSPRADRIEYKSIEINDNTEQPPLKHIHDRNNAHSLQRQAVNSGATQATPKSAIDIIPTTATNDGEHEKPIYNQNIKTHNANVESNNNDGNAIIMATATANIEYAAEEKAIHSGKIDYPDVASKRHEFNNRIDIKAPQAERVNDENVRNHNFDEDSMKWQLPIGDDGVDSNCNNNERNSDWQSDYNKSQENENKIYNENFVEKHEIENINNEKESSISYDIEVTAGDNNGYVSQNQIKSNKAKLAERTANSELNHSNNEQNQFVESTMSDENQLQSTNETEDNYEQTKLTEIVQPSYEEYNENAEPEQSHQEQFGTEFDQQGYADYASAGYPYAEGDAQNNYTAQIPYDDGQVAYDETYQQDGAGNYDEQTNFYQDPNEYNEGDQPIYDPQQQYSGDLTQINNTQYSEQPENYQDYQYQTESQQELYPNEYGQQEFVEGSFPNITDTAQPNQEPYSADDSYYTQEPGENYYAEETNQDYGAHPGDNYEPGTAAEDTPLGNPQTDEIFQSDNLIAENVNDQEDAISNQTTYSEGTEHLNLNAQPHLLVSDQTANFLESETDDSIIQPIQQQTANSESDFDFSVK